MSSYWEWYFIAIIATWTILFPAGGTELPATKKGYKWLRRYFAPALTLPLLLLIGDVAWWRVVLCCGLTAGAMTLPYGKNSTWLERTFTAVCMPLPTLFLGFSWWLPIFPIIFLALFALSNWKVTAKSFPWVVVCAIYGALIGACICGAAFNCWFCK